MTEESGGIQLRELLPSKLDGLEKAVEGGLREQADKNKGGLEQMTDSQSTLAWRFIRSTAAGEISRALDCDLFVLLAKTWAKARELREYNNKPPGETSIVHLGKHDFKLTVYPVLVVELGVPPYPELRFTLEVAAHFDGAALSIRDGYIVAVGTGQASATAQLKYGNVELHKKEESPSVKLPGYHEFKAPGLRIG